MRHSGGDGHSGPSVPGGEPEPAELWITGGGGSAGGPGNAGAGGSPGSGPGGPSGLDGPGGSGGPGHAGPGRTRWIALAAGFAVLVAVIAVQHGAGGHPAASEASSSATAPVTPSPSETALSASATASSGTATATATGTGTARTTAATRSTRPSSGSTADEPTESTGWVAVAPEPGHGGASAPATPTADTTSPTTSRVGAHLLPGADDWELVGYGPAGVVRYEPATGTVTVTPVPTLQSTGPLSVVVTDSAVILRPLDGVPGYVIPDGKAAAPLRGILADSPAAYPGPDRNHVWALADGPHPWLVLVDRRGHRAGSVIRIPEVLGMTPPFSLAPDGDGYLLGSGISGTYDLRPGGPTLITRGIVLAAGRTAFLVYDCDQQARCGVAVVDRSTGHRRALPALADVATLTGGASAISANGRWAAILRQPGTGVGARVELIDLRSGAVRTLTDWEGDNASAWGGFGPPPLAFSPDGRYLLIAGAAGVTPVDVRTEAVGAPLPIPQVRAIVIRPAEHSAARAGSG